jgi:hypothetical protein
MLFAFGPEDLERLAIPIGIGIAGLLYLLIPSWRKELKDSYGRGRTFRQKHPVLAKAADAAGVLLLVGVAVWFVYGRK